MEEQTQDSTAQRAADQKHPIDPLRRVRIPIEKKTLNGTAVFRTADGTMYARLADGSIRRTHPKVNGREARKLRAQQRQLAQQRQRKGT